MGKPRIKATQCDLPPWICRECFFCEVQDLDTGGCFGVPPQWVGEGWARPLVDPQDRGCIHFKPRHTA